MCHSILTLFLANTVVFLGGWHPGTHVQECHPQSGGAAPTPGVLRAEEAGCNLPGPQNVLWGWGSHERLPWPSEGLIRPSGRLKTPIPVFRQKEEEMFSTPRKPSEGQGDHEQLPWLSEETSVATVFPFSLKKTWWKSSSQSRLARGGNQGLEEGNFASTPFLAPRKFVPQPS